MRRGMMIALYGAGGLLGAGLLSWAAFTVAGQQLSTPAEGIQPVTFATATSHASPRIEQVPSPRPSPRHHEQASSPRPPVPTPTDTAHLVPSIAPGGSSSGPRPNGDPSDDHNQHGDD